MKPLSKRLDAIEESPLTGLDSDVKRRIEAGEDIMRLNVGEPDFESTKEVKIGIERMSVEKGLNFYTKVSGSKEVRFALSVYHENMFGVHCDSKKFVFANGAKEAVAFSIGAIAGPGDDVLLIAPYWSTYKELVKFFGAKPVVVNTKKDCHLNMKQILLAITPRTKAIIINSPNNPSGAVYSKKELTQLVNIAIKNDLYIISDEIYNTILFEENYTSIASIEGASERAVIINGFSKSASATGFRLGYAVSENMDIINGILKIKSNFSGNTNSFFQEVVCDVIINQFDGFKLSIENMKKEFVKRGTYLWQELHDMGFQGSAPQGAFYVWCKIPDKIKMNSLEFSKYMLDNGVAITPGVYFGDSYDRYVRISFASSMENLKEAVIRIKKAIK
ncbi:MAG: aminotransferase class I/II-fold pyridoxal phosphate-dependent enzyme [Minisyncoccia bacterium]